MRRFVLTILAVALAGLVASGRQGADAWRIHVAGYGPVRAGMTLDEASAAIEKRLVLGEALDDCAYATADGLDGVSFMVIGGRIARVDVESREIATLGGARIGDSEASVKARYPGRIRVSPHAYVDGHYLTYVPKDRVHASFRIVFETEKGTVTSIRAGRLPEVGYVEGCS